MVRSTRIRAGASLVLAVGAGCRAAPLNESDARGLPAASLPARAPDQLGLGHPTTAARVALIDIDANPAGAGLPAGQGGYEQGATIYAQKCASCHGVHGEGQGPYPKLIGREPRDGFPFATDAKIPKTIGNYWPYSTTVYDYIHRAMPFNAPGSLAPDEVYSLVAYLLAENQVIPRTAVMNAQSLPKVQMPALSHFVVDDRHGGRPFR
ncbi:MAG: cytochrome c [Gemmatimonadaceae bacterium]